MNVSVLIPTYKRPVALAATLATVAGQTYRDFEVIVADQSEQAAADNPTITALCRWLAQRGNPVQLLTNLPRRGMAQQRQFLLDRAAGQYCLFLDDDVLLDPNALERLVAALNDEGCGFAGMALIGLSYRDDQRPAERQIEFWQGAVQPERVRPGDPAWARHSLHNAANILHAAQEHPGQHRYKVAWVGGCVLYDSAKLREVGGFSFWSELPPEHCGEDVMAQLRLLERHGGFGLLPSGAYHQELPTTVVDRRVNAPEVLLERAGRSEEERGRAWTTAGTREGSEGKFLKGGKGGKGGKASSATLSTEQARSTEQMTTGLTGLRET